MEENKSNKPNKSATILLALLLVISAGVNIYQWKNHGSAVVAYDTQIDSLVVVRVDLEKELATSSLELEKYRGMSEDLDSLLNEANDKIAIQEKKIRGIIAKEKNNSSLNKKLKQELAELRKLKDEYFEQIDQLVTENKELKAQNVILQESVGGLKNEKTALQKQLNIGSQLKTEYVKVASYKKRGSGKFVESSIAKRTNKLEVCFVVLDNKIAEPGDRMVYAVITEPGGKVLGGYSKATFNEAETGTEMMASASEKINYTGAKQNMCLSYESDERLLTSGTYSITIYIDGILVAESAYILK